MRQAWPLLLLALAACNEQGFSSGQDGRLAVVVGDFDDPSTVLKRLAVPHDTWAGIISSATWNPDWNWQAAALQVEGLLAGDGQLFAYDQVWIGSGTRGLGSIVYNGVAADSGLIDDPTVCKNLRAYVKRGGTVVVTDWAYDLVEACWPRDLDGLGDDEVPDSAQMGVPGDLVAEVVDERLAEALGSDTLLLTYDYSNQVVLTDTRSRVTVWLRGDAVWHTEEGAERTQAGAPLLVSFSPGGGRVVYSTFHLDAQNPAVMDRLIQLVAGPLLVGQAEDTGEGVGL